MHGQRCTKAQPSIACLLTIASNFETVARHSSPITANDYADRIIWSKQPKLDAIGSQQDGGSENVEVARAITSPCYVIRAILCVRRIF